MPETISQSKTHDVERLFGPSPVLCDGAMGTMFYARGVFINRCFDELNLTDPQMVRELHEEYLLAGAEVIETNTFGANAARLKRFGLEGKVAEINTAAVRIARAAVNGVREKHAHQAFVAGALGSLGFDKKDADPAMMLAAYTEQVNALVAAGVDLFVVETITSLAQAKAAIQAARDAAPELPVIAMITVTDAGIVADGTSPEDAARLFEEWGARAVGCNCSDGPMQVLDTIERMRKVTKLPIAAMPNAGLPNCVDGRSIYLSSPEYLASFARKAMRVGRDHHRRLLRHHAETHQSNAFEREGHSGAGGRCSVSRCEACCKRDRTRAAGRTIHAGRPHRARRIRQHGRDRTAQGHRRHAGT